MTASYLKESIQIVVLAEGKIAFDNGTNSTGYYDKSRSVVDMMSQSKDIDRMREIICAYREVSSDVTASETLME